MCLFNQEQIYIVTGASSGLGEDVALSLNKQGATVIAIARSLDKLEIMRSKCKFPERLHLEPRDLVEDLDGLGSFVNCLKEKYGRFAGMVYSAGVSAAIPLRAIDKQNIDSMFLVNYYAPILMTKAVASKKNNIGQGTSIVVISSCAPILANKGHTIYAGSKAALSTSIKCISKEVISLGVRVNSVAPSIIMTPMTDLPDFLETQKHMYPIGFGEPNDVSELILFLLSSKSKFISGQNYIIDSGGL